jgi:hypothetical protein
MVGRWICYILAASLSLSAMAMAMVEFLFRSEVKPRLEHDRGLQERFYQPYLDDQTYLLRSGLFKQVKVGQNDAGIFLNSKVFWSPVTAAGTAASTTDGIAGVNAHLGAAQPLVPIAIRETLLRLRGDFMRKFARSKNMVADLSIFTGLERYDYWDLEVGSPIAELIGKHKFVPPPRLPTPEPADLLALAKLRLMLGALNGDFVASLSDVRQLANLMLTTENMQLVLAALSTLEAERSAYRYFVEERGLKPNEWTPVDGNVLRRASRAVGATRAFLRLWTSPAILNKVYLSESTPIGFCAAANESFPLEYSLRPRLEPRWPLEMSLKSEYQHLDKIFQRARENCRIRYLADLVDSESIYFRTPGPLILNRLPYSRKVFALRASTVNFVGLDSYAFGP